MAVKALIRCQNIDWQSQSGDVSAERPKFCKKPKKHKSALGNTSSPSTVEQLGGWAPGSTQSCRSNLTSRKGWRAEARRAARQQPRHMRSASISYVQRCVKVYGRPLPKLSKHICDTKKELSARYLQLKSGHAVTGVHLMKIKKMQNARCWWCSDSRQSVAHLMLSCRKWRRERERMLHALEAKKIKISTRRNEQDVLVLFRETAVEAVLHFIECTIAQQNAKGQRRTAHKD